MTATPGALFLLFICERDKNHIFQNNNGVFFLFSPGRAAGKLLAYVSEFILFFATQNTENFNFLIT
jgi:hypothetical protein